jgi:hypothetical protein
MCVVLNDDEVSSNKDEPLQKRLRQLFSVAPMVLDETAASTATADKEATDKRTAEEAAMKRATEEATVKRAMEERAAEEATTKAVAAKEVAGKTANEAAGAAEGSPAPGQAPSVAGAKRAVAPSGSTPPAKRPYRGVWKPRFVQLSLSFFQWGFSFLLHFLPRSSPSDATTAIGMAAADVAIRVTPGPAPDGEPQTPEGVPEDVVESEGEPEVASEPVPVVIQEEAPAEGAMIAVHAAGARTAPLPSCGARAPLSSVPPAMAKHAQEDDSVREGGGAGPATWFRPAGGGHRPA